MNGHPTIPEFTQQTQPLSHRSLVKSFGNSLQHSFYASNESGFSLNHLSPLLFQLKHTIKHDNHGFWLDNLVLLANAVRETAMPR